MEGINFYAIPMGKFAALIKVDKRDYKAGHCRLENSRALGITYIDFEGTRNEEIFWKAIRNNWQGRKKRRDGV